MVVDWIQADVPYKREKIFLREQQVFFDCVVMVFVLNHMIMGHTSVQNGYLGLKKSMLDCYLIVFSL